MCGNEAKYRTINPFLPNLALLSALISDVSRGRALHLDTLLFLCSCCDSTFASGSQLQGRNKHDQPFMQEFHPHRTEEYKKSRY